MRCTRLPCKSGKNVWKGGPRYLFWYLVGHHLHQGHSGIHRAVEESAQMLKYNNFIQWEVLRPREELPCALSSALAGFHTLSRSVSKAQSHYQNDQVTTSKKLTHGNSHHSVRALDSTKHIYPQMKHKYHPTAYQAYLTTKLIR